MFSIFVLALLLVPVSTLATEFVTDEDNYTLSADEVSDDDLYLFARNATVSGTVNGDLFVFGGNIDVSGTINGDLWVFGGQVNFSGIVTDDLRSGSGNVVIEGEVGDDVLVGAGTLTVQENAVIGGDITAGAGDVSIAGTANSVLLGVGSLRLEETANIQNGVTYYSDTDATVEDGTVYSNIERKVVEKANQKNPTNLYLGSAFAKVGSVVAMFLMLLVIMAAFPIKTKELTDKYLNSFGTNILWGIVAGVLIPAASIILLISLVFIPFGVFGFLVFPIFLFLARVLAIFGLGLFIYKLINKDDKEKGVPIVAMLIGLILVNVFVFIPIVGWFVNFILYLAGGGVIAVEATRFFSLRKREKKL